MIREIKWVLRRVYNDVAEVVAFFVMLVATVLALVVATLRDLLKISLSLLSYGPLGFSWKGFLKSSWVAGWCELVGNVVEFMFPTGNGR